MSETKYLQTSVYLTPEDRVMLDQLMERTGLSRSALFRLALEKMFEGGAEGSQARLLEIADELRVLAMS